MAKYSEIVNLSPIITSSLDIACLAFLAFFRYFKSTWSAQKAADRMRNVIFTLLCSVQAIIFVFSAF